jgi:hypothetical protein
MIGGGRDGATMIHSTRLALACFAAALASTAALADAGPVATGREGDAPPTAQAPLSLPEERAARERVEQAEFEMMWPDRRPHGEVVMGIGTHGYRHFGGMVVAPVGKSGTVAIAVEHMEIGGGRKAKAPAAQ